ncbi:fatty acid CoA ligase family protein [Kitasatospora sp. NPDC058218]|uniref:fatty acid CoA ligase family protein n=1 Tax=Kitasatospora sp. NPDC058218 TaxID=3346385 RepID=UPI0036DA8B86
MMAASPRHPFEAEAGLADYLERHARTSPEKTAIIHPDGREPDGGIRYRELSYGELQRRVEELATGFSRIGITSGMRTILMPKPGPDLYILVFALLRIGAVPVVVDPGMGIKRMLNCYRAVGAEAFVGPSVAHAVRVLGRRTFATVRIKVTLGRRWFWGGHTLDGLLGGTGSAPAEPVTGDDLMMIAFTTGSTGAAKGVESVHRMATATARQMHAAHGRDRDDVSLVTVPIWGLFDLIYGSTMVLAPIAPAKVAQADPELLTAALTRFGVSTVFGSPALFRVLAAYLERERTPLPALRSVVSAGAPVPPDLVASLRRVLDERTGIHVAYGATEAMPISSIESAEILGETAARGALGDGTCVGRPVDGTDVRIVRVSDDPLPDWEAGLAVAPGEIGEIVVSGDVVSPRYHATADANAQYKIRERPAAGPERSWHRTGDLGYLDDAGRLWFCGRRAQRVRTAEGDLHTVRCEGVFNAHPLVRRSALVGIGAAGAQRPVVCVETEPGVGEEQWPELLTELRRLGADQPLTAGLQEFLRHPGFPVDIRHNAKIGREELAGWAEQQTAAHA